MPTANDPLANRVRDVKWRFGHVPSQCIHVHNNVCRFSFTRCSQSRVDTKMRIDTADTKASLSERLLARHVALWRVPPDDVRRPVARRGLAHPNVRRAMPQALSCIERLAPARREGDYTDVNVQK